MSVVGASVVLGLIIVVLLKLRAVRLSAALVCILFGLVLGVTPIGGAVNDGVEQVGAWLWKQVSTL